MEEMGTMHDVVLELFYDNFIHAHYIYKYTSVVMKNEKKTRFCRVEMSCSHMQVTKKNYTEEKALKSMITLLDRLA
jgi:hypothetical protein